MMADSILQDTFINLNGTTIGDQYLDFSKNSNITLFFNTQENSLPNSIGNIGYPNLAYWNNGGIITGNIDNASHIGNIDLQNTGPSGLTIHTVGTQENPASIGTITSNYNSVLTLNMEHTRFAGFTGYPNISGNPEVANFNSLTINAKDSIIENNTKDIDRVQATNSAITLDHSIWKQKINFYYYEDKNFIALKNHSVMALGSSSYTNDFVSCNFIIGADENDTNTLRLQNNAKVNFLKESTINGKLLLEGFIAENHSPSLTLMGLDLTLASGSDYTGTLKMLDSSASIYDSNPKLGSTLSLSENVRLALTPDSMINTLKGSYAEGENAFKNANTFITFADPSDPSRYHMIPSNALQHTSYYGVTNIENLDNFNGGIFIFAIGDKDAQGYHSDKIIINAATNSSNNILAPKPLPNAKLPEDFLYDHKILIASVKNVVNNSLSAYNANVFKTGLQSVQDGLLIYTYDIEATQETTPQTTTITTSSEKKKPIIIDSTLKSEQEKQGHYTSSSFSTYSNYYLTDLNGATATKDTTNITYKPKNIQNQDTQDLQSQTPTTSQSQTKPNSTQNQDTQGTQSKQNTQIQSQTPTTSQSQFIKQAIAPTAQASAIASVVSSYSLFLSNINDLNKRLGELRNNPKSKGFWARIFNGMNTSNYAQELKNYYFNVQGGYDDSFDYKDSKAYFGWALSYGHSNLKSSATNAKATPETSDISLKGNSNLIEFGIYYAYVSNQGFYSDTIFKGSYINNTITLENNQDIGTKNNGILNTHTLSLGEELGYRWNFLLQEKQTSKHSFYIEPSIEMILGYVQGNRFDETDKNARSIQAHLPDILALRGRIGANLGYSLKTLKHQSDFRIGMSYIGDKAFNGTIDLSSDVLNAESIVIPANHMGIVSLGINTTLNESFRAYLDLEAGFGGKHFNQNYLISLGGRWGF
ncbi:hypothetical protein BKH41_05220 [Helicobacter sp. 12S02232-10]|nr:hypothetical protein BKH41_05220 [Helicobacter sp. 12S02232-10]